MSHVDAPRGLKWVGSVMGADKPPMIDVIIPASTAIPTGGIVTVSNAGVIALTGATAFSATTTRALGIATGYLPSSATAQHLQCINPAGQIFETQWASTTTADTMAEIYAAICNGTRYGFANGATIVSGLNVSGMYIDGVSGSTDGTHVFQLVGFPNRPDNALEATSANLKVWVRIINSMCAQSLVA